MKLRKGQDVHISTCRNSAGMTHREMISVSQQSIALNVPFGKDINGNSIVPGTLVENACATWHLLERDDTVLLDARWDELPIHHMPVSVCIVAIRKAFLIVSGVV